ncbi:FAD dependent oxidoreductase [Podospora didyma]|uniref:FAD dependent oxidoreductase n=1 Tax=Podospora didyma TaxID=330526 RepID=A0AAE0NZ78_9PEZI|nr:FAD dependent oxidoreductase [Podospora didyma]
MPPEQSFIIVGAGNFGAATALALKQDKTRNVKVTLIDTTTYPNPGAASHDVNKIIRPDYADLDYMKLMAEVMPCWQTDELYKPFYHEVGVVRVDSSSFSDDVMKNYDIMYPDDKTQIPAKWLSVEEARVLSGGPLRDANYGGVDKVFWNPASGWAAAAKALEAVVGTAIKAGVQYSSLGVKRLIIDDPDGSAKCTGVVLGNGEVLKADVILVAAGAHTAVLLADSAPKSEKIQAGDRLLATGAISFYLTLPEEKIKDFVNCPVVKNSEEHTKGSLECAGESMGMTPDGVLKFNCDISFTNNLLHPATQKVMSIPPTEIGETSWTSGYFPKLFKERSAKVLEGSYGELVKCLPIEKYRMCWDATTPTHDFLITPHPHCANLCVASGGSFHGWKFLPVIGKYIVRMMDGRADGSFKGDLAERWAWDRDPDDKRAANPTYQIEGDLQDMKKDDE